MKEANPDIVLSFLYEIPAQTFLRQANELGFKPTIMANGSIVNLSLFQTLPAAAVENFYGSTVLASAYSSPSMKPILDTLRSQNPGKEINWLPLLTIAGANTLLEAMKKAGPDITAEKVRAELEKLTNFPTSTLAYPISYTQQNHSAGTGMHFYSISNGVDTSVMPGYWPGRVKASAPIVLSK